MVIVSVAAVIVAADDVAAAAVVDEPLNASLHEMPRWQFV